MQRNSEENNLKLEVVQALKNAAEKQETVIFSPKDKPISMFSHVEEVTDEYVSIRNSIPPLLAPYVVGASSFQVLCGPYWVRCDRFFSRGRELRIPLTEFGTIEMARADERHFFSETDDARVRISHPFDSGAFLTRRVFDFSDGGMSFRSRLNTLFMQPGRHLPSLEIFVGGELRAKRSGQVVYVKQVIDALGNDYFQVGVRFDAHK
jgi:hypothetical protein